MTQHRGTFLASCKRNMPFTKGSMLHEMLRIATKAEGIREVGRIVVFARNLGGGGC